MPESTVILQGGGLIRVSLCCRTSVEARSLYEPLKIEELPLPSYGSPHVATPI